jgi:hypothetical protein
MPAPAPAGADPMSDLLKLADEMKFSRRFEKVSLGQGQGPKAEKLLLAGMEQGLWVCLQNCHLAVSWMPQLERICEGIDPAKASAAGSCPPPSCAACGALAALSRRQEEHYCGRWHCGLTNAGGRCAFEGKAAAVAFPLARARSAVHRTLAAPPNDCMRVTGLQVHKDFRLWLTSLPSPDFPASILQSGIKMSLEPPQGLKANMLRQVSNYPCPGPGPAPPTQHQPPTHPCYPAAAPAPFSPPAVAPTPHIPVPCALQYGRFSEQYLASCPKPAEWRSLLFGMCLFHAVVQVGESAGGVRARGSRAGGGPQLPARPPADWCRSGGEWDGWGRGGSGWAPPRGAVGSRSTGLHTHAEVAPPQRVEGASHACPGGCRIAASLGRWGGTSATTSRTATCLSAWPSCTST